MKKQMFRNIMIITLFLSVLLASLNVLAKENISISKTDTKLYISATCKLKVTGAEQVEWSSKDESIATVSDSGKVKAKKAGSTEIIAKVNGKNFSCKVTVVKFTKKVAERLVKNYIKAHDKSGYMPSFILVDHIEGNIYSVHAYDNGDQESITYNWYNVNKITGKIEPIF